jgi:hypothetical protein
MNISEVIVRYGTDAVLKYRAVAGLPQDNEIPEIFLGLPMSKTISTMLFAGFLAIAVGQQVLARDALRTIELDKLIAMYMVPANANYDPGWRTGSEADTPISWQDNGLVDCNNAIATNFHDSFCRTGNIIITVGGKPTHTILGRTVGPGHWSITLAGGHAGVNDVFIHSDVNADELTNGLLKRAAAKPGSVIQVGQIGSCGEALDGTAQLNVTKAGMKPMFVRETWSCGSAGCSIQFELANDKDTAQRLMHCDFMP